MRHSIPPPHRGSGNPLTEYTDALQADGVAIFLFHGVIPSDRHEVRNYTRKHLTADRFAAILDSLAAAGTPVAMDDLVAATRDGSALPPRAFVITFDDGFENNYSVAAPILEQRGIPATFYVTSGFIDGNTSSWTDLIEHAFELRGQVSVAWDGSERAVTCETAEQKRAVLDRIRAFVKSQPAADPYAFADAIRRQLGVAAAPDDPHLDRKLSWRQVRELSQHVLFTIGGHGHTHRILAFLGREELEREIATSITLLQPHVAGPLAHYSYPEGLAHCYSDDVVAALRRHGIACSPTAEPGINRVGDDLFHLKRISVV